MRIRRIGTALVAAVSVVVTAVVRLAPPASAATLTEVTGFGTNPSSLRMFLYVPANVTARPAIVVADAVTLDRLRQAGVRNLLVAGVSPADLADGEYRFETLLRRAAVRARPGRHEKRRCRNLEVQRRTWRRCLRSASARRALCSRNAAPQTGSLS